ncbi:MAG: DUF58 domain-containing protein [Gemmatimonadota bacterium]
MISFWSVPAAILVQALVLAAAAFDRRRAVLPSVERVVRATGALHAVGGVELRVHGAEGPVRVTDDVGPGIERLPAARDGEEADASSPRGVTFGGDGSGIARYRIALHRRGDLVLGAIHVRALGPLGLAWRDATYETEDRIRVQPGLEELKRRRLPGLRPELAAAGLRRLRRFGEGSEFESLREYQLGDDPRIVDWKASARRQELLVRNYQAERNQTVVLAIDAGRLMRERIGDRERLDHALAAALVLAERARSYGDRLGLIVFDDRVRTIMPAGRVRLATLADAFAMIESRTVEPNYPMAFATLRRTFRKRSLVLVFSDVIDDSASKALVQGLVGAAARHLPVAVAIRNPEVEAATQPAEGPSAPYRRAAAEELLEVRARALRSMRRAGVQTVDALPGAASEALLAKYAEIKGRGLL